MPTITERRRDAVKQGIYEAAVEVLTRDGLDGATMDRVAAEAGICKGSLYNYFKDKQPIITRALKCTEYVHKTIKMYLLGNILIEKLDQ